jgi:hypothetical protein
MELLMPPRFVIGNRWNSFPSGNHDSESPESRLASTKTYIRSQAIAEAHDPYQAYQATKSQK